MTCDEYQEQASQYIDGEMRDEDAGELFTHLGACVDCRSFLRVSLELRSKIHDDILKEEAAVSAQPATLTSILALPLVVLLGTIFLFLGVLKLNPQLEAGIPPTAQAGDQFQAPELFWPRSTR